MHHCILQRCLFSNLIQFTHGKVNARDQNLGGLQSLCDNKTESKVVFSGFFCWVLFWWVFWFFFVGCLFFFGCCCYLVVFGGRFFCNTTIWSWTYARKGAPLNGGRFHGYVSMYFILSCQYVTLCFVLKSCRTEVMHWLLPVGSNNMQSLYNLPFSKPLCRCEVINEYNTCGFSQSVRCVMDFQQLHTCIHVMCRVPVYVFV